MASLRVTPIACMDRVTGPLKVGIVGGGISGSMVARHLRADHPGLDARVTIFEPRAKLGAGLAYDTEQPEHRINIPASRTVFVEEDVAAFQRWLVATGATIDDPDAHAPDGEIYPRRGVLARYAGSLLAGADIDHARMRVSDAVPQEFAGRTGFAVTLSDGSSAWVDHLVLATGHPRPVLPLPLDALPSRHCIADPFTPNARRQLTALDAEARVLIIGCGLTACDVAAGLAMRGHRGALTMVSRRGLLSRRRRLFPTEAAFDFLNPPAHDAVSLLRQVRARLQEVETVAGGWELVIDALRRQGTQVWRALAPPEKQRLFRHLRAYWDAHRFQSAPQIDACIDRLTTGRQLTVLAGRVKSAASGGQGRGAVTVELLLRSGRTRDATADVVVNCTGPSYQNLTRTDPLLSTLAGAGTIRPDPCGLGLETDLESRAYRADGTVWDNLWVAGPLARYAHGELMGLPQVSLQPRAIACAIDAATRARASASSPLLTATGTAP